MDDEFYAMAMRECAPKCFSERTSFAETKRSPRYLVPSHNPSIAVLRHYMERFIQSLSPLRVLVRFNGNSLLA